MKTLWNVVSFLAVVNLLALLLFALWLLQSDRLSAERLDEARALFAPTILEAQALAELAERDQAEAQRLWEEQQRALSPPVSSGVRIEQASRMEEMEQQMRRRIDDERRHRLLDLDRAMAMVEEREVALERVKRAWRDQIEQEMERRRDEQFAKAVRQYESIRPRQAKEMLLKLIQDGGIEQAVAYLDAMNARTASKIIEEFKTDEEIRLATELLERLRTFGVPAEVAQDFSNAD